MSLAVTCGWSVLRSLSTAALAIPLCLLLSRKLRESRGGVRLLIWILLLVPFLMPELLIGYAYSNYSLSLVRHPVWNELFYALLILLKLVPLGSLIVYFSPPAALSAEALFCHRLAMGHTDGHRRRFSDTVGFLIRGPLRSVLPAFAVLFLLSFQEFETASLMQCTSWTVWLFDAQAGGLFLTESLRYAVLPVVCEVFIVLPVLLLVLKDSRLPATSAAPRKPFSLSMQLAVWGYLAAALILLVAIPLACAGRNTYEGLRVLLENQFQAQGLAREIATGIAFAVFSGMTAYAVATLFLEASTRARASGWSMPTVVVLSVPGLLGSLVLCLSVLYLFQRPGLNALYDSPIPLVLASMLFVLPRAMLLQLLLLAVFPGVSQHLARLLRRSPLSLQREHGREVNWQLRGRGHFWAAMLVCYWVYWDLTAAAILSPTGVVTAPVRLYNLMHYGQNTVLSAMMCLAVAAPVMLLLFAAFVRRPLLRRVFR